MYAKYNLLICGTNNSTDKIQLSICVKKQFVIMVEVVPARYNSISIKADVPGAASHYTRRNTSRKKPKGTPL